MEWTTLPEVPVIVNTELPVGVFLCADTVSVEVPEAVTVAGEKLPVARAGSPETLKLTVPLKPPEGVTVTV